MRDNPRGINLDSRLPKRNVVFAWDLHYSCNFRCPYCFYTATGWTELAKKNRYRTPQLWEEVWKRIHARHGPCQLRITGGEPFTYPDFPTVISAVCRRHDAHVTSNCSASEAMRRFAQTADPDRVELDCTFHPLSGDFETFARNVAMLREHGFVANVCYLAYPPQIPEMAEFKRRFAQTGLYMNVAIFWGDYQGRQYPFAYTEEEKGHILQVIGSPIGPETVNLMPLAVKGRPCGAGQRYAVIQADGRVFRCGQLAHEGTSIGNICARDFKLSQEARPCPADYCRCKEFQSAWDEDEKAAFLRGGNGPGT